MVYPTKDAGLAIGEIIAAISEKTSVDGLEIRLTADALVANIRLGPKRRAIPTMSGKSPLMRPSKDRIPMKTARIKTNQVFEYNGKSLTISGWAKELGVSYYAIRRRVLNTGNPYGLKGPSETDKVVAASATVPTDALADTGPTA